MENLVAAGLKSIREAVEDGSLIDVTALARKADIPFPTFMTPFMVAKYEAQGPAGLYLNLRFFAGILSNATGHDIYGPIDFNDHVCIFEPHEEHGHVVVILEAGKAAELDLKRSTGDGFVYAM